MQPLRTNSSQLPAIQNTQPFVPPLNLQFFHYPEQFRIHESQVKNIILSGCTCNYVVNDGTKITGYITNRIHFNFKGFY